MAVDLYHLVAVLGVVSYIVTTVVDMACDVMLPVAHLLDKILTDLASELCYYY